MYDAIQMLKPGQSSTSTSLEPLLGIEVEVPTRDLGITTGAPLFANTRLKLVKASAAIASSNKLFLLWTATTGSSASTVSAIAGAAAVRATVAGVALLPGTGAASGDYFWVAVRGPAVVTCPGVVATNTSITTDAAGKPTVTGITFDTLVGQTILATTAADCIVDVRVR